MSRPNEPPARNELTVMFFFAGDNNLSPSMISQLKAIKDAGFQKDTTVLVRFDPNEKGARTRIFEVNARRKKEFRGTHIGDGEDPFVRNLREDDLMTVRPQTSTELISDMHQNTLESTAAGDGLRSFLRICRQNAPANHYMLFLVGHGMIVGNDAFLPDDSPESSISLRQLGEILWEFARTVENEEGILDLVGMHSCSMSSIEVAYELKGTARYMMATEGISFVGSWPYRQLLKKIFHSVEKAKEKNPDAPMDREDINLLLRRLCSLAQHNSTDFMFAGFSADLALCNLNKAVVEDFNEPLEALTSALKAALEQHSWEISCGAELILLAHWRAQSYWQENYTDLYDFCRCLSELCAPGYSLCRCSDKVCDPAGRLQKRIRAACAQLMEKLELTDDYRRNGRGKNGKAFKPDRLVAFSRHFGPTYQYSHGLSIYFPWSRPVDDGVNDVIAKYKTYEFTKELVGGHSKEEDNSWLSFLEAYFEKTRRRAREEEDLGVGQRYGGAARSRKAAAIGVSPAGVNVAVSLNGAPTTESLEGSNGKPSPSLTGGKTSPSDSGGVGCGCPSIKNYPTEFPPLPAYREVQRVNGRPDRQGADG